jgi:hypothetical protein
MHEIIKNNKGGNEKRCEKRDEHIYLLPLFIHAS